MISRIAVRSEVENSHANTKYKLKAGFSYFYFIYILYLPFHTIITQSALINLVCTAGFTIMRRTYKPLFWRATRPVNATDCKIEGRYCLKPIIIDIFTSYSITYFHSFIQSVVFTGSVARQNNGLYVLRMIVKRAYLKW